jgi:magnesium transporter
MQRDVVDKLARNTHELIDPMERVFFRDVHDHMVRLYDLIDNLRDLLAGLLDIYFASLNKRINDTVKTLTIFTALFMPLSFVTGFFGMNFFRPFFALPTWTGPVAFTLVILLMLFLPVTMFLWMRQRAWM